jgi:hypothetical protein
MGDSFFLSEGSNVKVSCQVISYHLENGAIWTEKKSWSDQSPSSGVIQFKL